MQSSYACCRTGSSRADAMCCFNMLWSPHIKGVFQGSAVVLSKIWCCVCGWRNFPTTTFKRSKSHERLFKVVLHSVARLREIQSQVFCNSQHAWGSSCAENLQYLGDSPGVWAIGSYSLPQTPPSHPRLTKVTYLPIFPLLSMGLHLLSSEHISTPSLPLFSPHASTSPFAITFFPENFFLTHCTLLPVIHLFLPVKNQDLSHLFYYLACHKEGRWHQHALMHAEWGS